MDMSRLLMGALIAFLLTSGTAQAEYLAYAVGKQGKLPLPESIDAIDSRYLVQLEWGPYEGGRARVAVLPVDNTSSESTINIAGPDGTTVTWGAEHSNMVPVNGIEAIIADAMIERADSVCSSGKHWTRS